MKVYVRHGFTAAEREENFERAMKQFKKRVNQDGILSEVKSKQFFVKPGVVKRLKKEAAIRKQRKKVRN